MKTFEEYQVLALKAPLSLRKNRDRIGLPIIGLQQEAGRLGALFSTASESGKFSLTQEQSAEVKDMLSDLLWYVAVLCAEAGISLQDVAEHSVAQLQGRTIGLDPDRR